MKLKIGLLFLMLTTRAFTFAQTGNGEQRDFYNANSSIQLKGIQCNQFDTSRLLNGGVTAIPTDSALKLYIAANAGGGGTDSALWKNDGKATGNHYDSLNGYTLSILSGKTILDSVRIGKKLNTVGVLVNQSFAGTSTPSGWSLGSVSGITFNNKAICAGSPFWGAPSNTANTTPWGGGIQFNTLHMPYEKLDIIIPFVINTKVAGGVFAITKGSMGDAGGIVTPNRETIALDLGTGYTSGRVKLGQDSVTTFTTAGDSTARANLSNGDTCIWRISKDEFSITSTIFDKATGIETPVAFSQSFNGTGGLWNFMPVKSAITILNIYVSSDVNIGGNLFIGTSQTSGAGVTAVTDRYTNLLYGSNTKYFDVVGLPSSTANTDVSSGLVDEVLNSVKPSNFIVELGYNDRSNALGAATYSTNIDSVIVKGQRSGATVFVTGIIPVVSGGTTDDVYNDTALAVGARLGCKTFNIRTPLLNAAGTNLNTQFNWDNIHVNNAGHAVWANVIRGVAGAQLLNNVGVDSVTKLNLAGIPLSSVPQVAGVVCVTSDGRTGLAPYPEVTNFVQNVYTPAGIASNYVQPNFAIAVDNSIRTNNFYQNASIYGLRMSFFNDSSNTNTGNNIEIANHGDGTGTKLAWKDPSNVGKFNIFIGATFSKNAALGVLTSASVNNLAIGEDASTTLTSGANNTLLNVSNQVTTGTENIIVDCGTGNGSTQTTGNHAVLIGAAGDFGGWGNYSNRIHIGYTTGFIAQTDECVLAPNSPSDSTALFWIGGENNISQKAKFYIRTPGLNGGGIGKGSSLILQSGSNANSSGTPGIFSIQTNMGTALTYNDRLIINQDSLTLIGSVNFSSTTRPVYLPRLTTAQFTSLVNIGKGAIFSDTTIVTPTIKINAGTSYWAKVLMVDSTTTALTNGSIPVYNSTNQRCTYTTLTGGNGAHTIFTPTTGGTVALVNNQNNIINPTGALVALTVTLPSSPNNNDVMILTFEQAVTTVTYSGGTVAGSIVSPVAGSQKQWVYDSVTTTWY